MTIPVPPEPEDLRREPDEAGDAGEAGEDTPEPGLPDSEIPDPRLPDSDLLLPDEETPGEHGVPRKRAR
jgi:hypothetical protein